MIATPLTRLLAIEHPIVAAGMGGGMAPGELAGSAAVVGEIAAEAEDILRTRLPGFLA